MKKMLYMMSVVLPMTLLVNVSDANAQRQNHTRKDVPVAGMAVSEQGQAQPAMQKMPCNKDKKCDKMMDSSKWLDKKNRDINEEYNEALEKINKSTLSEANKSILKSQAAETRDLVMKQAKERSEMMGKQFDARKGMRSEIQASKQNRKAVKEIMDID